MELKKKIKSFIGWQQPALPVAPAFRKSYAQHGEDLLVEHLLRLLQVEKPFFIDVGAHHPFVLSNTYLLYEQGARGVNIEPDPALMPAFLQYRPDDVNLGAGIQFDQQSEAELYLMSAQVLNTFSKAEAIRVADYGTYRIVDTIKVPLLSLQEIVSQHAANKVVDFLTIDVEGLDKEIIRHNNLDSIKPKILCVETVQYTEGEAGKKDLELINMLQQMGYAVYADTHLNTIFVDAQFGL